MALMLDLATSHHLKSILEHPSRFVQSDADQYLFISDKVIVLVCVNDTLLFARNQQDIEKVIDSLREQGHSWKRNLL
jgi:hypothetical protein